MLLSRWVVDGKSYSEIQEMESAGAIQRYDPWRNERWIVQESVLARQYGVPHTLINIKNGEYILIFNHFFNITIP